MSIAENKIISNENLLNNFEQSLLDTKLNGLKKK